MCDVSKDEDIERLFATFKERYGKLHTRRALCRVRTGGRT